MCWFLFFGKLQQIPIPREQKQHSKALCTFPDESLSRVMLKLWRYPWTANTRRALRRLWLEKTENEQFCCGQQGLPQRISIGVMIFHSCGSSTCRGGQQKSHRRSDDKTTEPIRRCTSLPPIQESRISSCPLPRDRNANTIVFKKG